MVVFGVQVRNNILVALADWCMRFTGVVDSHVARLAACLADPHPLLRKQGLALLACLLSKACLLLLSCRLARRSSGPISNKKGLPDHMTKRRSTSHFEQ